jgi:hypothetical protein
LFSLTALYQSLTLLETGNMKNGYEENRGMSHIHAVAIGRLDQYGDFARQWRTPGLLLFQFVGTTNPL